MIFRVYVYLPEGICYLCWTIDICIYPPLPRHAAPLERLGAHLLRRCDHGQDLVPIAVAGWSLASVLMVGSYGSWFIAIWNIYIYIYLSIYLSIHSYMIPIGSMVLYMVTWIPSIYPKCWHIYTIHGSYGIYIYIYIYLCVCAFLSIYLCNVNPRLYNKLWLCKHRELGCK